MEPIVIIGLLLGAFALGAESADTQPVKTPEPVSEQQPKELSGRAVQSTVQTCLSNPYSANSIPTWWFCVRAVIGGSRTRNAF